MDISQAIGARRLVQSKVVDMNNHAYEYQPTQEDSQLGGIRIQSTVCLIFFYIYNAIAILICQEQSDKKCGQLEYWNEKMVIFSLFGAATNMIMLGLQYHFLGNSILKDLKRVCRWVGFLEFLLLVFLMFAVTFSVGQSDISQCPIIKQYSILYLSVWWFVIGVIIIAFAVRYNQ